MEKKNRRHRNSSVSDDLSIVKAAAWAWYQRGSGSQESSMREFDTKLTRLQSPKPSRYKIEAVKIIQKQQYFSSITAHTDHDRNQPHSLLDAYEAERISKQLDNLVISSSKRFNEVDGKQVDPAPKSSKHLKNKKKGLLKLIWWRHSVVCGSREDVNSGALVRTRPPPAAAGDG